MNKRGSIKRLMLEIAYISFAVMIGLAVLVFVYTSTNDTTLKAKLYAEDLVSTINAMNNAEANQIKASFSISEIYKIDIDQDYVYVNDKEIQVKSKYNKKPNSQITFTRNKDTLILEKNEQESIV